MHLSVLAVSVLDGPGTDCVLVAVVPGTHLSPHHAAAGSDAPVSPVISFPLPALPEPQQPPRSAESEGNIPHVFGFFLAASTSGWLDERNAVNFFLKRLEEKVPLHSLCSQKRLLKLFLLCFGADTVPHLFDPGFFLLKGSF